MQLTSLKQSTTDPVLNRLEKNGFSTPTPTTNKRDDKDLKCLNDALEVERNRLVEMIKTLQKRLDDCQSRLIEKENHFLEQKRVNNRLEKDCEKLKMDLNNVKNRTGD